MDLRRFWRHILMSPWAARRAFPESTLDAIEREIGAQEKRHRGELRFVVELELSTAHLWHEVSSRDRAREVFAQTGVWNTEENTGVLVYLLLAERRVEIVADRGISAKVSDDEWRSICAMMESRFGEGRHEEGAIAGIRAISDLLATHFPARLDNPNELPDRPLLI
ncbi:MAG: TPM domain-containing protein [Bacillota bacterium]